MRPLDALASVSRIERLLTSAAPGEVRAEIERLASIAVSPEMRAALAAAKGMFAVRSGDYGVAETELRRAADELGDPQAAALAVCEALVAKQRTSRAAIPEVVAELRAIESRAGADDLVFVTAAIARGAAHMAAGETEAAVDALAAAVRRSEGLLPERVRALNAIGTLYAALGEPGAATAALEHSCELAQRLGLATSEAIARGQLGSLALARGDLAAARAHFGAQELLASKLGDLHGQARALTYLAEVALLANQADAALELGRRARGVAQSASPPLAAFDAFAERIEQRASAVLGRPVSDAAGDALRRRFEALRVPIGVALVDADAGRSLPAIAGFASLGLTERIAAELRRARESAPPDRRPDLDETLAAVAQAHPHVGGAHAADLLFLAPQTLAAIAGRRLAAQRNLAKLAALRLREEGLWIAVAIVDGAVAPPESGAAAALAGAVGALAAWVWPIDAARDAVLAELRRLAGAQGRAVLVREPNARVASVPFAGEPFARVTGIDLLDLAARARALALGEMESA